MDREMLEGVIMELETMLDNMRYLDDTHYVPAHDVEALRDRLKFVLDNTPDD